MPMCPSGTRICLEVEDVVVKGRPSIRESQVRFLRPHNSGEETCLLLALG